MKKICSFNSRKYSVYLHCFSEKHHLLFMSVGNNFIIFSLKKLMFIKKIKNFGLINHMILTENEDYLFIAKSCNKFPCNNCYLVNLDSQEYNFQFKKISMVIGYPNFVLNLAKYQDTVLLSLENKTVLYNYKRDKIITEIAEKFPADRLIKLSEEERKDYIHIQYIKYGRIVNRIYVLENLNFREMDLEDLNNLTSYSKLGKLKIDYTLDPQAKKSNLIIYNRLTKKKIELCNAYGYTLNYNLSLSENYIWMNQLFMNSHHSCNGLLLKTNSSNVIVCGINNITDHEFNFDEELNYITTNDYELEQSKYFSSLAVYQVEEQDYLNIEFSKFNIKNLPKIQIDKTICEDYWI